MLLSGFCCVICLISHSGARVAEQRCLLSRSAHYNRQALFIAFVRSSLLLIIAYKIFEYMNSFTALMSMTKSSFHHPFRVRECALGGSSSFDGNHGGSRYWLLLIAMWVCDRLHAHAGITANYHHWAWGGWSSQEAGSFGAPAGHYQFQVIVVLKHIVATIGVTRFQVFAFAFALMQRMEQSISIRYR